jgi:hypothetical protein
MSYFVCPCQSKKCQRRCDTVAFRQFQGVSLSNLRLWSKNCGWTNEKILSLRFSLLQDLPYIPWVWRLYIEVSFTANRITVPFFYYYIHTEVSRFNSADIPAFIHIVSTIIMEPLIPDSPPPLKKCIPCCIYHFSINHKRSNWILQTQINLHLVYRTSVAFFGALNYVHILYPIHLHPK